MRRIMILLLIGSVLVGCAADPSSMDTHVVKIGSVSGLEVKDLHLAKINDNLNIQAAVYNDSRSIQQIYYRCRFFDSNKFQINNDVQWVPVQIYGKSSQNINCTATSPTAIDFKLEISSTGTALKVYQ